MQKRKDLRFKPYYVNQDYWDTMENELAFRYTRGDILPRIILGALALGLVTLLWAFLVLFS